MFNFFVNIKVGWPSDCQFTSASVCFVCNKIFFQHMTNDDWYTGDYWNIRRILVSIFLAINPSFTLHLLFLKFIFRLPGLSYSWFAFLILIAFMKSFFLPHNIFLWHFFPAELGSLLNYSFKVLVHFRRPKIRQF